MINLHFQDKELKGYAQSVEYSPEQTAQIEAAGGWFYALWNEMPEGGGYTPLGDGVVYVSVTCPFIMRPVDM